MPSLPTTTFTLLPVLPQQLVPAAETVPTARPVLYACFSCAWCYAASQLDDELPDRPGRPHWRMVDPHPRLPHGGLRLDAPGHAHLQDQLTAVRADLLACDGVPDRVPASVPRTRPAVVGYAEACGAGVGDAVRIVLFEAYWQHGADIGDPEVLRHLLAEPVRTGTSTVRPLRDHGYAVTRLGGPLTDAAHYRVRAWDTAWRRASGHRHPALVQHGITVTGPDVVSALRSATGEGRSTADR